MQLFNNSWHVNSVTIQNVDKLYPLILAVLENVTAANYQKMMFILYLNNRQSCFDTAPPPSSPWTQKRKEKEA